MAKAAKAAEAAAKSAQEPTVTAESTGESSTTVPVIEAPLPTIATDDSIAPAVVVETPTPALEAVTPAVEAPAPAKSEETPVASEAATTVEVTTTS